MTDCQIAHVTQVLFHPVSSALTCSHRITHIFSGVRGRLVTLFMATRTFSLTRHPSDRKMSIDAAPKISLALGTKKQPQPSPTNGVKRSHAALGDEDDEAEHHGRVEEVSHFDQRKGGAIDSSRSEPRGPLVIASQSNRDWKQASHRNGNKRQRNGLPADAHQEGLDERVAQIEAEFESRKAKFGLNVKTREEVKHETVVGAHPSAQQLPSEERNGEESMHAQSVDQRAVNALLGVEQKSDLVLPATANEDEAFHRDFNTAPDMSTLADYDRVPVEQFGAALLRGMGWKDGEGIGAQRGKKIENPKIPERRPALLGIGAKEEAAIAQEMGAWGKAAKGRGGEIKIYNPVLLKDKKTGEKFTEEEWEKRKLVVERAKYELEFEEKEKERRRKVERRNDRERDDRREPGSTNDDRRNDDRRYRDDRSRRDEKSRRRDDYDRNDQYYGQGEQEYRRRDHVRREDDRKSSSRRHDERYRDRSRDRSHRDRHRR
nr:pre-mrna-splicing factor spp2 [Quercus suber]